MRKKSELEEMMSSLGKKANAAFVSKHKKPPSFDLFQISLVYKKLYPKRNFIDKPFYVSIQYVSPEVFMSSQDAEKFVPFFIKRLMEDKTIGEEVLMEDRSVNLDLLSVGITKLKLSKIQAVDEMEVDT